MEIQKSMLELGKNARNAFAALGVATNEQKNKALLESAKAIRASAAEILAKNQEDLAEAKRNNLSAAFLDRLTLNPQRIESIAKAVEEVASLPDPVGKNLESWTRPNGLKISRVAVPIGVIGMIYESRPNVTADAGAICLKSGNAVILRCGSDSLRSSGELAKAMQKGLVAAGLPAEAIQLVSTPSREAVSEMLSMTDYIDLIIPRGGKSLTQKIRDESKVATLLHLDGNCHVYIHEKADEKMAIEVLLNAKMRRTGICGAAESLVIDKKIAANILPKIVEALTQKNCEIRGDDEAQKIDARVKKASEADFGTEYLDAIISVKIIDGIDDAISHINHYGSHHTDAIITTDTAAAKKFAAKIDSAIVLHNASTQFADGGEFGFGCEIGIATGRLHARGPVGTEQLTTYKYLVEGNGQIRP